MIVKQYRYDQIRHVRLSLSSFKRARRFLLRMEEELAGKKVAAFPRLLKYSSSVPTQSLFTPTTTMRDLNPYDLRARYTRCRILVIGRANAGKTTLLQRVCNTTEDPCVYGMNNKNLVSVHKPEDEFCF